MCPETATAVCDALRRLEGDGITAVHVRSGLGGMIDATFITDGRDCGLLVQACCVTIAATPVDIEGAPILPVLRFTCGPAGNDVDWASPSPLSSDKYLIGSGLDQSLAGYSAVMPTPVNPEAYKADMVSAAALLEEVRRNTAQIAWQPVRHADNQIEVLYRESSIHRVDHWGFATSLTDGILAVERIGSSPALDCYVASRVIDELQASPEACLGVTISARSAVMDFWWTEILARLSEDRSLGPRLFIELSGTAPFPPTAEVVAFVDRLRCLGCAIVLGNFGTGFSSIRSVLAFRPSAIKIDALFLHQAARSCKDRAAFLHLAGLAHALAPVVVLEGVDTSEHFALANQAGVLWQKGRLHGEASITRAWKTKTPRLGEALPSSQGHVRRVLDPEAWPDTRI